jgi:hypothetical protein
VNVHTIEVEVMTMNEQQRRALIFSNRVAPMISLIGLFIFISSFFVSGPMSEYVMYGGIGVVISSGFLYGFGLVLALVEEKGANPSH